MDETLKVALLVAKVLEEAGVPWFIGGSLASSIHGVPRATLDADIIADVQPQHIALLVEKLKSSWYADPIAIQEAITHRSSFNLIHLDTAMKVDIFIPKQRAFDRGQFERAKRTPIAGEVEQPSVCAVEDIVAAKLEWFRLGNEISDRQWKDIVGVLRSNKSRLKLSLLKTSAAELGVMDLLERACNEAEIAG